MENKISDTTFYTIISISIILFVVSLCVIIYSCFKVDMKNNKNTYYVEEIENIENIEHIEHEHNKNKNKNRYKNPFLTTYFSDNDEQETDL
jgi:hypothetical protein